MKFWILIAAVAVVSSVMLFATRWRRSSEATTPDGKVIAQLHTGRQA